MGTATHVSPRRRVRPGVRQLAFAGFVAAWFLYFNWGSLKVGFAPDDMMNMAYYWRVEPWRMFVREFAIWGGYFRPMAAAFYLPLFHLFHFNPLPYHAGMMAVMAANCWLAYLFARAMGAERLVSGLVALVVAYHPGLKDLYYNTAFIYDALCLFFYLSAFLYYLRIRPAGEANPRLLRVHETAVFLALFLCALNSKEMAVSLPVMLLVYEWMYHRPAGRGVKELAAWVWGPGRVALMGALLNLVYIYGKAFGPEAMTKMDGYRPVFSLHRFMDFQRRELTSLLIRWPYRGWIALAILWLLLLYIALRRRRPYLVYCWILMWIAPLPIEFLEGRDGACLAIPLVAWAMFAATVFVDMARAVAGFLAGEPGLRRVGQERLLAAVVVLSMWWLGSQWLWLKRSFVQPGMNALGRQTNKVLRDVQSMTPRVNPHDRVIFLSDPFVDWDMAFIGELWFQDRSVNIVLQRKTPLPADEIARANRQFDFRDGKLIQVR